MTAIQTVSLYAAAFLLLLAGLAIPIAVWRTRTGIALGSGESQPLYLAIRAHGNASEWIPAFVLGLFLLASLDAPAWSIHALGAPLLAARVLHACFARS